MTPEEITEMNDSLEGISEIAIGMRNRLVGGGFADEVADMVASAFMLICVFPDIADQRKAEAAHDWRQRV